MMPRAASKIWDELFVYIKSKRSDIEQQLQAEMDTKALEGPSK